MQMLQEIHGIRQDPGGLRRRWFSGGSEDLYVWEDGENTIQAFEFCYDKHRDEHAFRWRRDLGMDHVHIDNGEPVPGVNATPLAAADGEVEPLAIIRRFEEVGTGIEPKIFLMVLRTLHTFYYSV